MQLTLLIMCACSAKSTCLLHLHFVCCLAEVFFLYDFILYYQLTSLVRKRKGFAAVKTSYTVGDTTFAYLLFPVMMETKVHVLGQK